MSAFDVARYAERHSYAAVVGHQPSLMALRWIGGWMPDEVRSVLDVGCGIGDALRVLQATASPSVPRQWIGLDRESEMVDAALRIVWRVEPAFRVGDARALPFEDDAVDLVVAVSVLHHLCPRDRRVAIREMGRVARRAVALVDGNAYGQGARWARLAKRLVRWPQIRTMPYRDGEEPGVAYSGSLIDHARQVRALGRTYWLGTEPSGPNLTDAPQLAVLVVKP